MMENQRPILVYGITGSIKINREKPKLSAQVPIGVCPDESRDSFQFGNLLLKACQLVPPVSGGYPAPN